MTSVLDPDASETHHTWLHTQEEDPDFDTLNGNVANDSFREQYTDACVTLTHQRATRPNEIQTPYIQVNRSGENDRLVQRLANIQRSGCGLHTAS